MSRNIFTAAPIDADDRDRERLDLPEGLTIEALDAYAAARRNQIRRANYATHPEKIMRQRLRAAVTLLEREGCIDRLTATGARGWILIRYPEGTGEGRQANV